jgi:photosystem II stability/assembly factor-like uncharacterized protein
LRRHRNLVIRSYCPLPVRGDRDCRARCKGSAAIESMNLGLAWEGRGGTLRTSDGGRTWNDMPPGGSDVGPVPQGGQALTDRDWLVLIWDGDAQATILYATHDAGTTWHAVSELLSAN